MKNLLISISISFIWIFFLVPCSHANDKIELQYPNAVNKLFIKPDQMDTYSKLAEMIGLQLGVQYSYTEFADIKRENKIGAAGTYEPLLLSTGGNAFDFEALDRFNKQKCGWEMTYYSNYNLTMIYEVCHDEANTFSLVRVLKLCTGRNANLNIE